MRKIIALVLFKDLNIFYLNIHLVQRLAVTYKKFAVVPCKKYHCTAGLQFKWIGFHPKEDRLFLYLVKLLNRFKPVKLETNIKSYKFYERKIFYRIDHSCTVILSPMVSVLCTKHQPQILR